MAELKAAFEGELSMTQDDLAMQSQELEKLCCSFEECVQQQQAASEVMQPQMHARFSVLDRKLEGDALVSEHEARAHLLGNMREDYVIFENNQVCCYEQKKLADMNAANAVLKVQLEKALADVEDLHHCDQVGAQAVRCSSTESMD